MNPLDQATELREQAEGILKKLVKNTHCHNAELVLFARHARREHYAELGRIIAELDNLVEKAEQKGHYEGHEEGVSETQADHEAMRHEPVSAWETEP